MYSGKVKSRPQAQSSASSRTTKDRVGARCASLSALVNAAVRRSLAEDADDLAAFYSVPIAKSAAKELERLPTKDRHQIVAKIIALADDPRPMSCKKLSGDEKNRLRQVDDRIPVASLDTELIVTVARIGNRRDVHRRQRDVRASR